jgi:hypothetical protein
MTFPGCKTEKHLPENPWKAWVIEQLIVWHIYEAAHETDPLKALGDLIDYEIKVALDPSVSSEAVKLRDHYLLELNCCKALISEQKALIMALRRDIEIMQDDGK